MSKSFLIQLQTSSCKFIRKKTLTQAFSYEFSENFKKTPHRTTPVAASVYIFLRQGLSVYKISTVHCKVFICGRDARHHLFERGVFDRKFDKDC